MLRCLRAVASAPPGRRHPTIVGVAARLFGLAKAGALDPCDVRARIIGRRPAQHFRSRHAEVDTALLWAWEQSDPWRLP